MSKQANEGGPGQRELVGKHTSLQQRLAVCRAHFGNNAADRPNVAKGQGREGLGAEEEVRAGVPWHRHACTKLALLVVGWLGEWWGKAVSGTRCDYVSLIRRYLFGVQS